MATPIVPTDSEKPALAQGPPAIHIAGRYHVAVLAYGGFLADDLAAWLLAESRRGAIGSVHFVNRLDIVCARNAACLHFLRRTHQEILLQINRDLLPRLSGFELDLHGDLGGCDVVTARYAGPEGEYHKDGHASGFMAIRRPVLEAFGPPWFGVTYDAAGTEQTMCECETFIRRVRQAGFKAGRWTTPIVHRHMHEYRLAPPTPAGPTAVPAPGVD